MKTMRNKPGPTLRNVLTLFFWLFICGGLVLFLFVAGIARLYRDSDHWPVARGLIVRSEVTMRYVPPQDFGYEARRSLGRYLYQASIEYQYSVDGHTYHGRRIGVGGMGDAHRLVERFAEGKIVSVYYDESRPERALLIPGVDMAEVRFRLGVLAILPIAGLIGLWWIRRHR